MLKLQVVMKLMDRHNFIQFAKNNMQSLCEECSMQVYDIRNAIALRVDLHQLFDDGLFVYVPKNEEMRLHFLSASQSSPNTRIPSFRQLTFLSSSCMRGLPGQCSKTLI
jgi:hypothetical protein